MRDFMKDFSDEEMVRDWSLSDADVKLTTSFRKSYRLYIAIQLCSIRLYGKFSSAIERISPRIVQHLNTQLDLPVSLYIEEPTRKATRSEYHQKILSHLQFKKYDGDAQQAMESWATRKAESGLLPQDILELAGEFLMERKTILPSTRTLERQINSLCARVHAKTFSCIYSQLTPELKAKLNEILTAEKEGLPSFFSILKDSPPSATISSMQEYLRKYRKLDSIQLDQFDASIFSVKFMEYLSQLATCYNAKDIKRFKEEKRFSLLICFLFEARKELLDTLVNMHDQYITVMLRKTKNAYEKRHRDSRKKNKKALDVLLKTTDALLELDENSSVTKKDIFQKHDEGLVRNAVKDLYGYKHFMERGYGNMLLARYPSMRKYFSEFIGLPFEAKYGNEDTMEAINLVRKLDAGKLKTLPPNTPTSFIPNDIRRVLYGEGRKINRNAWETGLAIALKEKLRSGDLFIPKSKEHILFWSMLYNERLWEKKRDDWYKNLDQPLPENAVGVIREKYFSTLQNAKKNYANDTFATVIDRKLKISKDDAKTDNPEVKKLQATINACLPSIRIETLMMEVDTQVGFTRKFVPIQKHSSRPENFYKTLMSAILSQATNLGIVSMSSSVQGVSVDMLRHVLQHYIRPETINAANAEIVNAHHKLPVSSIHGTGEISSSDAQRFKIRADSLLGTCYCQRRFEIRGNLAV